MERKRFDEIDFVRALGIVGVIIIHILTYNLSTPLNRFLWNYLQFVVVAFVFCSGFVLTTFYQNAFVSISKTLSWYKKRFIRLIIPFWIYLIAHYILWIVFPNIFSGLGLSKSLPYFIKSAFFIGGDNLNWLPLIFLQLTFLFPIFIYLFKKKRLMGIVVLIISLITGLFTVNVFPYSHYRVAMWIPWSLVLLVSMHMAFKENLDTSIVKTRNRYLAIGSFVFVLFLILFFVENTFGKSINFYDHKYPPDFYYLFFGIALTCLVLIIGKIKIWQNSVLKRFYFFISKNSYQIFFIHYIILDAVLVASKKIMLINNPLIQFIIIFFPSLFIAFLLGKILSVNKNRLK